PRSEPDRDRFPQEFPLPSPLDQGFHRFGRMFFFRRLAGFRQSGDRKQEPERQRDGKNKIKKNPQQQGEPRYPSSVGASEKQLWQETAKDQGGQNNGQNQLRHIARNRSAV